MWKLLSGSTPNDEVNVLSNLLDGCMTDKQITGKKKHTGSFALL
jgi:hypothetical protein